MATGEVVGAVTGIIAGILGTAFTMGKAGAGSSGTLGVVTGNPTTGGAIRPLWMTTSGGANGAVGVVVGT